MGGVWFKFTVPFPFLATLGPLQLGKFLAKSANSLSFPRTGIQIKLVFWKKKSSFYFFMGDFPFLFSSSFFFKVYLLSGIFIISGIFTKIKL